MATAATNNAPGTSQQPPITPTPPPITPLLLAQTLTRHRHRIVVHWVQAHVDATRLVPFLRNTFYSALWQKLDLAVSHDTLYLFGHNTPLAITAHQHPTLTWLIDGLRQQPHHFRVSAATLYRDYCFNDKLTQLLDLAPFMHTLLRWLNHEICAWWDLSSTQPDLPLAIRTPFIHYYTDAMAASRCLNTQICHLIRHTDPAVRAEFQRFFLAHLATYEAYYYFNQLINNIESITFSPEDEGSPFCDQMLRDIGLVPGCAPFRANDLSGRCIPVTARGRTYQMPVEEVTRALVFAVKHANAEYTSFNKLHSLVSHAAQTLLFNAPFYLPPRPPSVSGPRPCGPLTPDYSHLWLFNKCLHMRDVLVLDPLAARLPLLIWLLIWDDPDSLRTARTCALTPLINTIRACGDEQPADRQFQHPALAGLSSYAEQFWQATPTAPITLSGLMTFEDYYTVTFRGDELLFADRFYLAYHQLAVMFCQMTHSSIALESLRLHVTGNQSCPLSIRFECPHVLMQCMLMIMAVQARRVQTLVNLIPVLIADAAKPENAPYAQQVYFACVYALFHLNPVSAFGWALAPALDWSWILEHLAPPACTPLELHPHPFWQRVWNTDQERPPATSLVVLGQEADRPLEPMQQRVDAIERANGLHYAHAMPALCLFSQQPVVAYSAEDDRGLPLFELNVIHLQQASAGVHYGREMLLSTYPIMAQLTEVYVVGRDLFRFL